ncbi:MAG: hypothetical protein K0Q55_3100 [Verrucomicrobia bacterium]|jgi:hypothetical protein|nr:hypothetical protein [Verrucomicrobiota bacterium]
MSTFTCGSCQKEWTENYCHDCGQPIQAEEHLTEDDICSDGSVASLPARVRVNPFRYLWFEPEARSFYQAWFILIGLMIFTAYIQWWVLAGVLLVIWVPITIYLGLIFKYVPRLYKKCLLTPAMVVSQRPLEFIALVNMDAGTGEPAYAIKREAVPLLPFHSHEIGTLFPCVSSFNGTGESGRWTYFSPVPISFGTGDAEVIEKCMDRLGDAEFAPLLEAYEHGNYPTDADETFWLDEKRGPINIPRNL